MRPRARRVVLLGLAVAVAVGAVTLPALGSFAPSKQYPTARDPISLAAGDLNGDRKPDLVTANVGSDTVSIFFNGGDGSFRSRRDYIVGREPTSAALGDLNGDGHLDVVVTNSSSDSLSVLVNNGRGGLARKRDLDAGNVPQSATVSDLNGDGAADIVVVEEFGHAVSVFLNQGDGGFDARRDYGVRNIPVGLAVADLNGDGAPDIVTGENAGGEVWVLLNNGDGTFGRRRRYRSGSGDAITVADVNGDRKPDIVAWGYSISVLLNAGRGTFPSVRSYHLEGPVAIADLDRDRKPDLAISTSSPRLNVLSVFSIGSGGNLESALDYRAGFYAAAIVVADLNGDHRPDVAGVTSSGRRKLWVLLNRPGLCNVQYVRREPLAIARSKLARAGCRLGTVRNETSARVKRGRVISQKPEFGAVLPQGAKVSLIVSLGASS